MWHLRTEKEVPSGKSGNELSDFMDHYRWENYLDAFYLCWFFPSADTSDALKVALLTSSATDVKAHSQSSHAKKGGKPYFNAQKT